MDSEKLQEHRERAQHLQRHGWSDLAACILELCDEVGRLEAQHPVALQAGMSNDELRLAWSKKLPGVEPTDRLLGAFALGAEVGYERAAPVAPAGEVTVTTGPDGNVVAVTRTDDEHRVLSVIWEKPKRKDCPHAAPFRYCQKCPVSPCPVGLDGAPF